MSLSSIGDLAQSFITLRSNARLSQALATLGTELTTGIRSDPRSAVTGDIGILSALERSLVQVDSYTLAAKEAAIFAEGTQTALGRIQDQIGAVVPNLLLTQSGGDILLATSSQEAAAAFTSVVSSLNTSVGSGYLFSGTATGTTPLRDGDDILADLNALVAGAPDAATLEGVIDAYFAPGGTFQTADYAGEAQDLAAISVSPNTTVSVAVRADDAAMRESLAALAKVAVLSSGALSAAPGERDIVVANATSSLIAAENQVIDLRANVGAGQARIDTALAENATESVSLQQARLSLIGIDPYETATRLQQTELQLESLYTVTARMSRLNLTNYL